MMRLLFKFLSFVPVADILGSVAVDVTTTKTAIHRYHSAIGGWSLPVHDSRRDTLRVLNRNPSTLRALYDYATNDQDSYYNDQEITYEDLKNNHDFQEWKESQLTDEDRQKQQEEEEKREQEYRQQQQAYQEQLMQEEMEKYQEYLAWKNETTWTNGTYGYSEEKDSSTSGLFYVESNDLLKGRQWTIGSSLMLVGMLIGFGGAVVVMRHKNKKTSKARPLMDDPKSDIA
jgi:hypothetical protein